MYSSFEVGSNISGAIVQILDGKMLRILTQNAMLATPASTRI